MSCYFTYRRRRFQARWLPPGTREMWRICKGGRMVTATLGRHEGGLLVGGDWRRRRREAAALGVGRCKCGGEG
jgi:hypothetical protein